MTTKEKPRDAWSAQDYNTHASFVYSQTFTSPVLTILDPKPGEKIYDFGCGSGELSVQIARAIGDAGIIVGVDASENMIKQARQNGLVHSLVSDIQAIQFPVEFPPELRSNFDAVFSNAALHWCKRDPAGVLKSVKSVLKPGGRFVAEMGGFMNCIGVRIAIHSVMNRRGYDAQGLDPWFFPSVEEYRALLEAAGFSVNEIALHPRPTTLPTGLYEWLRLFARESLLGEIADAEADDIMKEIVNMCEVDCRDAAGHWTLMYMRLRFSATSQ